MSQNSEPNPPWRLVARRLGAPLIELGRRQRRRRLARGYFAPSTALIRAWTRRHTEDDNFYYALTEANRADLAHLVALVTGVSSTTVMTYLNEIESDTELLQHLGRGLCSREDTRDVKVAFGRRIGWYAFVRILKPRVVVETGVHHGVGACLITRALMRNAKDGSHGRYFGTDIDPAAGVLFTNPYAAFGEILYGDSITSLRASDAQIDIFINDSDHSSDYEADEYAEVSGMLTDSSLVLGDNSHVTDALRTFAERTGRPFVFFAEKPADHWYPGAGIGISPSRIPLMRQTASR